MKIIITESQLKDFIRKQFNVDLSNKIEIVTNKWELPMELDRIITTQSLNRYLNHYGPMFVIHTRKNMYLVQKRGKDGWVIVNQNGDDVTDMDVMKDIGIEKLGLTVGDLIDEYFQEPINESNSVKYRLLRRESDMEHRIDNQLMMAKLQNDLYFVPLDHLILHIADNVAVEMARESNLDGDEFITFRNQIKQYIRTNFYEHIKEFWQSHQTQSPR
jgi:hypothetical protein